MNKQECYSCGMWHLVNTDCPRCARTRRDEEYQEAMLEQARRAADRDRQRPPTVVQVIAPAPENDPKQQEYEILRLVAMVGARELQRNETGTLEEFIAWSWGPTQEERSRYFLKAIDNGWLCEEYRKTSAHLLVNANCRKLQRLAGPGDESRERFLLRLTQRIEMAIGNRAIRCNYACPCCEHLTMPSPYRGTNDICPICCWKDDLVQFRDPELWKQKANNVSLRGARACWRTLGVSDNNSDRRHSLKRPPRPQEVPK